MRRQPAHLLNGPLASGPAETEKGNDMPDGKRKRRFSDNAARRAYYADYRARRFAKRLWAT